MPHAHNTRDQRAAVRQVVQDLETALGLHHLKSLLPVIDRQSGGVVAPVFQTGETLQQDGRGLLLPNKTNNATHKMIFLLNIELREDKLADICTLVSRSQPLCFAVTRIFADCVRTQAARKGIRRIFRPRPGHRPLDTPFSSSSCPLGRLWRF